MKGREEETDTGISLPNIPVKMFGTSLNSEGQLGDKQRNFWNIEDV